MYDTQVRADTHACTYIAQALTRKGIDSDLGTAQTQTWERHRLRLGQGTDSDLGTAQTQTCARHRLRLGHSEWYRMCCGAHCGAVERWREMCDIGEGAPGIKEARHTVGANVSNMCNETCHLVPVIWMHAHMPHSLVYTHVKTNGYPEIHVDVLVHTHMKSKRYQYMHADVYANNYLNTSTRM